MSIRTIVPAVEEPVTLDEAKLHCRVDSNEEDALLGVLIAAARERAEHETGRALCTQTRELACGAFALPLVLRGAPVQSMVSVEYLDTAGALQTFDLVDTQLDNDSEPGYLWPAYGKAWPATRPVPNAVRVRYVCGYGAAAAVPKAIKQWILLAVGTLYAQRETMVAGQIAALPDRFWQGLIDPYRLYEAA